MSGTEGDEEKCKSEKGMCTLVNGVLDPVVSRQEEQAQVVVRNFVEPFEEVGGR